MKIIKKIKEIILIIVMTIMIVLNINIVSQATVYVKDDKSFDVDSYDMPNSLDDDASRISVNFDDAGLHSKNRYDNIFCVQKGKRLKSIKKTYYLREIITISGNTATSKTAGDDSKYKKQTEKINGRLVYAIHNAANTEDRQDLIWWLMETWKNDVGKNLNSLKNFGISKGTGSVELHKKDLSDNAVDILGEAKGYAKLLNTDDKTQTASITQLTSAEKLTVRDNANGYYDDGYDAIGPLKFEFKPDLASITLKDQDGNKLDGKTGDVRNYYFVEVEKKDNKVYLSADLDPDEGDSISSGESFYIMIRKDYFQGISNLSIKLNTSRPKGKTIDGKILFWECVDANTQNMIMVRTKEKGVAGASASASINVPLTGSLQIEKVDADNSNLKMANVGFKVQNVETGGWVKADSSLGSFEEAKTFMTGVDGKTEVITNLLIGNYKPVETVNPYSGYIDTNPNLTQYVSAGTTQNVTVVSKTNKHVYTSISGYVWVDGEVGKTASMNGTFDNGEGKNGIRVRLWDHRGDILVDEMDTKTTRDSNGQTIDGKYQFDNVKVDDLKYLHIDFYYDGITYATVNPNPRAYQYNADGTKVFIDAGTKAVENSGYRENLNNKFGNITNNGLGQNSIKINDGVTNDTLGYSRDIANYKSTVSYAGIYPIVAARAGAWKWLKLEEDPSVWQSLCNDFSLTERFEEIKAVDPFVANGIEKVNLGLKVREKPNMSVLKDIERVKLSINGYNHIYNYNTRYQKYGNNQGGFYDGKTPEEFNVGVKFGNEYGSMAYTRPIYKSDYTYENPKDKSKELQVYITYKIMIYNNTTTLQERN